VKRRAALHSPLRAPALAALLAALSVASLPGCRSYTFTDADCAKYRDRLVDWAKAKGEDRNKEAEEFMRSCQGTTVSRATHECLEKAADEQAFLKCLE
jgi:hypothetical protein